MVKKRATVRKVPGAKKKTGGSVGRKAKRRIRGMETRSISVKLPVDVVSWLDRQALAAGISRSAMIDRAFRFAMSADKALEESGVFDEMLDELKRAIEERISDGIVVARKEGSRV